MTTTYAGQETLTNAEWVIVNSLLKKFELEPRSPDTLDEYYPILEKDVLHAIAIEDDTPISDVYYVITVGVGESYWTGYECHYRKEYAKKYESIDEAKRDVGYFAKHDRIKAAVKTVER